MLLDADTVEQRQGGRLEVDLRSDLVDGFGQFLRSDLSTLAFVGARLVFHDGNPVLFVTGIPGLDGAPGELAGLAIFIGERQLADRPDAGDDGFAFGHVDGAQDAHLEVGSGISHEVSNEV